MVVCEEQEPKIRKDWRHIAALDRNQDGVLLIKSLFHVQGSWSALYQLI
jgi:hypothetical protein